MSFTAGSSSFVKSLICDADIDPLFTAEADVREMIRFEIALAKAQADCGMIPWEHAAAIISTAESFKPDYEALRTSFVMDGVVPPGLLRQIKAILPKEVVGSFHLGATSQDLVDSSLMIRLKEAVGVLGKRLVDMSEVLDDMKSEHSDEKTLNSRTRMQIALPISVRQKLAGWQSILMELKSSRPKEFPLQLGGPDGTAAAFGEHYLQIVETMASELDLSARDYHWQTNRKPLQDVVFWLVSTANGLGKIGQDILIMAQSEVREISLKGAGGSSSMAHKQNPVAAEFLVAQARFCQVQASGLSMASIHENERSGTAMALEWMVLPQLVRCCGSMLNRADNLLDSLIFSS